MFIKFMFFFLCLGTLLQFIDVCKQHPRVRSDVEGWVDAVSFVVSAVLATLMWFYAFGGWTIR